MAFANKVTLITGSAGGLGLSIARAFLSQSSKVILVDINSARLSEAVASLPTSSADAILPLTFDITTEETVKDIYAAAVEKFGRVDILVNNAGIADRFDGVGTCELELWERVMRVNLTSVMLMSKYFVQHALGREGEEEKGGVILNVGSVGGERGGRAGAAYTASKHGVIGLTKNTAAFYSKKNIRCNAILPGMMRTNIADAMAQGFNQEGMASVQLTMAVDPGFLDLDKTAETVLFLCSDGASQVTGACMEVDRGWTSW